MYIIMTFSPVTATLASTTRCPIVRLTSKVTVRPESCRNLPPGSGCDASYWDTECSRIDISALPGILKEGSYGWMAGHNCFTGSVIRVAGHFSGFYPILPDYVDAI